MYWLIFLRNGQKTADGKTSDFRGDLVAVQSFIRPETDAALVLLKIVAIPGFGSATKNHIPPDVISGILVTISRLLVSLCSEKGTVR